MVGWGKGQLTAMQIGKYPANVLLHQPENTAYVEAGAHEESVHEAEGENGAGTGSGQQHVGERKQSWLHGKRRQSVQGGKYSER